MPEKPVFFAIFFVGKKYEIFKEKIGNFLEQKCRFCALSKNEENVEKHFWITIVFLCYSTIETVNYLIK